MPAFATIEKNLTKLGLGLNQRPINGIQFRIILYAMLSCVSFNMYLFHEANTSKEYMDAILITTEGMLIFTAYFSSIPQMANISHLLGWHEKMTETREFDYTLYL